MIFKKKKVSKDYISLAKEDGLDFNFYGKAYFDLSNFDDESLAKHWFNHGRSEGRLPSLLSLYSSLGASSSDFEDFQYDFYIDFYPDVAKICQSDGTQAYSHYFQHGREEGRLASFDHFLKANGLYDLFKSSGLNPETVIEINKKKGLFVDYKMLTDVLSMNKPLKVVLTESKEFDSEVYMSLGMHYELNNDHEKARNSYVISCMMNESAQALELGGNYYYRNGQHLAAAQYYRKALDKGASGRWIYENLSNCLFELSEYEECFDVLVAGKALFAEIVLFDEFIDSKISEYWVRRQPVHDALASMQKRSELISVVNDDVNFISSVYRKMYSTYGEALPKISSPQKRVLIVGDFFLPQCIRYRIDQKIEQLEHAGYQCDTVDWIKVNQDFSKFAFYDLVIFYRTPAVPEIVKAITYCDHLGKMVVYEIDDMVFDIEYPSDIESYGGYVDLAQYNDLNKGMALFNSAMTLCDYGLASTNPIASRLEQYVKTKRCFIHRNGFDSKNYSQQLEEKAPKQTIDIFYGSGTKAHNSDFIEEVLPPITKILDKYSNVRLVIAGFLNLPNEFLARYPDQVKFVPFVKSVEAYWGYLKQADINIAVLKSDFINDGKSELKWFEAAYFEIPSVVSATQNYKDVIDHGVNGMLASNHDEWFTALDQFVESEDFRKRVAVSAREHVTEKYSIAYLAEGLDKSLTEMLEKGVNP